MTRTRSGFALMTVLWIIVAASVASLATMLVARETSDAAVSRADSERAAWRANDCLERQRVAIDDALAAAARDDETLDLWKTLDRRVGFAEADQCSATVIPVGSQLNVNAATDRQLLTLFAAMGLAHSETLVDVLRDWLDPDDEPRPNGVEHDWYAARERLTPRNGPLADIRELRRIAGFEELGLDSVLTVDSGRIAINVAPLAVLAVLPGFTEDLLTWIANERAIGRRVRDLPTLASSISRSAADSVLAHYPALVSLTTVDPEVWAIRAQGWSGSPASVAMIEARVVLGRGARAAVTRRRRLP